MFSVANATLTQTRAGHAIASRALAGLPHNYEYTLTQVGTNVLSTLYLEELTMSQALAVIDVVHNGDGTKTITYDDSTTEESVTISTLNDRADQGSNRESLRNEAMAYWKARSADFSSSTPIVGKTFQKDMALELNQLSIGEL